MRTTCLLVVAAALVARAASAHAGACGSFISVSPAASPMPPDGLVLLELSTPDAAAAVPHARFVTSAGDVPARVVRVVENGRVQALLAPEHPLPARARVHLAVGIDDVDAALAGQPFDIGDAVPPPAPLTWTAPPAVIRSVDKPSRKGDGTHALLVRIPVTAPGWIVAAITSDGHTTDAIYPIADIAVLIGTAGCHSAYVIERGGPRHVDFTAIDAIGRATPAPKSLTLTYR